MATKQASRRRRGEIVVLPSGTLQVRVYAGVDPVTKKRHYLTETVPDGPKAWSEAEKVRTRLLADLDADRQPRTSASVRQLLERYLEVIDVEVATRAGYESLIRTHILPLLGDLPVGRVRGEVLVLVLRPAPQLPSPLPRRPGATGPSHPHLARLRPPVPSSPVPTTRAQRYPPSPRYPQQRLRSRCALGVDRRQPGSQSRRAEGAETSTAAPVRGSGRAHRLGGVEGVNGG